MVNQALDEARFWARTAFSMVALAITAGAVLTKFRMDQAQVASIVVGIMTFAGVMVAQLRNYANTNTKADEVKTTVVTKGDEVKDAILSVDRRVGEIHLTGMSSAAIQGEFVLALRANAVASARLAALEPTEENKLAAARAAQALRDHEALNPPLPTAPTGDGHGGGKEMIG